MKIVGEILRGVCLSLLTVGAAAAESPIECEGTEPFKFKVQASLNGGESWTSDYVLIWAQPGTSVDLAVRTCMSVSAGQTEGWSFSLRHDPSSVQAAGGDFQVIGLQPTEPTLRPSRTVSPRDSRIRKFKLQPKDTRRVSS